ncbi:TPA: DNA repair protein RecO [Patescibacteria group bacterium]|nr:MAG: repair protein RecO protein [Parcubacteria group bacterium GW2011_GWF2_40_10]KKR46853.1 MAG: repair protein RecO protein [Parcubacteria group bacterium GW2011_GWA2_40_143]KKR60312.1 MAG: repair protein RecO protein [Parcubacteria group bacterium GW2011_GWC2_40_31]KKR75336.1 MAG: repair protein RecO protein [Parcubacteria group bacterium GW2011_GWB2_40_8]KKR76219.1 MAG: repair protein RecO protein [Parcubacteria group bacterium GW2011_GWE2_40_8]KKR82401.1 MAG: repair protein RecO protei
MAHQIYQVEGIILKKAGLGEADNLCYIYTRQFGMIMASAKSIRLEKSKLRNHLDLFSFGRFGIINTKETWRIVDAEKILSAPESSNDLKMFAEMASLILRMVKGEEPNEALWKSLFSFFCYILEEKDVEKKKNIQIESTALVMRALGYMEDMPASQRETVSAINKAIAESML